MLTRYKQGRVTIRLAYCGVVWCGVVIDCVIQAKIREGEGEGELGAMDANGICL